MSDFKFIELKIFINDPVTSNYKFSIINQSHIGENFGDDGSIFWTHDGFELRSVNCPEAKHTVNRLFVRGAFTHKNDTPIILDPYKHTPTAKLKKMNTWFTNMLAAVHAYNNYYSKVIRTNILHKY